jgi:hypothetical protein
VLKSLNTKKMITNRYFSPLQMIDFLFLIKSYRLFTFRLKKTIFKTNKRRENMFTSQF